MSETMSESPQFLFRGHHPREIVKPVREPSQKQIMFAWLKKHSNSAGFVWIDGKRPSLNDIADALGMTQPRVHKAMRSLEQAGAIHITR